MLRGRRQSLRITIAFAGSLCAAPCGAADWLQFGYDAAHSGVNPAERGIAESVASFQQVYATTLRADADSAPAFLEAVATPSGTRDLLFLSTVYGDLVAVDAASGGEVWAQPTPGPAPITGAGPAVDPDRRFVYAAGMDGKVHKYRVEDGVEIVDGSWPELFTLKPQAEKTASALAFATAADGRTFLYVTTSNFGYDQGDYQGHVTAIDLGSGAQAVFNTLCSDSTAHLALAPQTPSCPDTQSGIWGRPAVVYDADTDRIYIATGNGPFDANLGGHDWSESVLALAPDLKAANGAPLSAPLDSYTPDEFAQLNANDDDLGVQSPVIVPMPPDSRIAHAGVQIGKDGVIRMLDLDDLSGQGGPGHIGGEAALLTGLDYRGSLNSQPGVWADPDTGIVWLVAVYRMSVHGLFVQTNALGHPQLIEAWNIDGGGTSPAIADGVAFFVTRSNALVAIDVRTGNRLWSAPVNGVHWGSPIVVDGTVYLADNDATLRAFAAPVQTAATMQVRRAATARLPASRAPAVRGD